MIPVLICGSRTFNTPEIMAMIIGPVIWKFRHNIEYVCGGAPGADYWGEWFAERQGKTARIFRADWDKCGKAAGPKRNQKMAEYCEYGYCFAFWDGFSHGTADMIRRAKDHDMNVLIHKYRPVKEYDEQIRQHWNYKINSLKNKIK